MINHKINVSPAFRRQTVNTIIAIAFFILTYFILLLLAVGLTVVCVLGGIIIIGLKPMIWTIALGIGLASIGVFVLFFLLKFIFSSHKTDRSHLIEISRKEEPQLFALIDEIVEKVGTTFPKKVYLSADVNAAVFYDSGFWSMFLPVRKNLQIGLGLVNTVTRAELTAILSHEFGHFSQKTMKVGSYVYNVNQIMFNMLYNNESYEKTVRSWANVSGFISIFTTVAGEIITGIQWVLKKLYEVVNKSYLALSREMEFHADAIAARVTGFESLKTSLLRTALADQSLSQVLGFYEKKISENQKSDNIYTNQFFVLHFLAEYNNIPIVNNLPAVTSEEVSRFNKSRLVIKDQWASHPDTEERITRLEQIGYTSEYTDHSPANKLFCAIEKWQKELTHVLFKDVIYQGEVKSVSSVEFENIFREEFLSNTFAQLYNGYYDSKPPIWFDVSSVSRPDENIRLEELFSDQKVDLVNTVVALQNDIEILRQISDKLLPVKTFDYDGVKYARKDCQSVISGLSAELEEINEKIKSNDIRIYQFFLEQEKAQTDTCRIRELYIGFFESDKKFDTRYEIYTKLLSETQFVNVVTPFDKIISGFKQIESLEALLKEEIRELLTNNLYKEEITAEMRDNFDEYLSGSFVYFADSVYNEKNLNTLFTAVHHYAFLLSRGYFLLKKQLLNYQEELINAGAQQSYTVLDDAVPQ